ncbi:MAG: DUF4361 domain-containing protein [Bacteroidota bacterium]
MKKILKITSLISILSVVLFSFYSCNKNDDLVTENAKTGGLVNPLTANVPYKLGVTTTVAVTVAIPQGPGIDKIELYNTYTDAVTGNSSNRMLMKTIAIGSANASKNDTISYTVSYAELIAGLTIDGNPMPANELLLAIGSGWTLEYVTYVGGRAVTNNATTNVGVANAYAGLYQCDGVFHHPTAGDRIINAEKFLSAISAYEVSSTLGDLGPNYPIKFTVNPTDNSVVVNELPPTAYTVLMQADSNSRYDPATGMFHVFYYYVGATGNRRVDEHYTPIGK